MNRKVKCYGMRYPKKTKVQHIKYNFFKRLNLMCKKKKTEKEECNFRAHARDTYLISLSGLKY